MPSGSLRPTGVPEPVDTVAIERVRDEFYDLRFRNNNSTLGEYDIKNIIPNRSKTIWMTTEIQGLKLFDEFMRALQDVKNNQP